MSWPLIAVVILVVGAAVVLLAVAAISQRPGLAPLIGVPFAVVAAGAGLQAPQPLGLAVLAVCVAACIALLMLPLLTAEVPAQVCERLGITAGDVLCWTGFFSGPVEVWSVPKSPYASLDSEEDGS